MELQFIKCNPTQNMTILVETAVPRDLQPSVSEALMDYGSVFAEQVGFLEEASDPSAQVRLQMMGGEFCGNAAMSCASYIAFKDGLIPGTVKPYRLEVSGSDRIVVCNIERTETGFKGSIEMPLPIDIRTVQFRNGIECPVVFFPGIAHAIMCEDDSDSSGIIAEMCSELDYDALGIIKLSKSEDSIRPLVYVRSTGSSVYERGCGSGTSAVIAYLSCREHASIERSIHQPGGCIKAFAAYSDGQLQNITITGLVKISAIGTAFVDL